MCKIINESLLRQMYAEIVLRSRPIEFSAKEVTDITHKVYGVSERCEF